MHNYTIIFSLLILMMMPSCDQPAESHQASVGKPIVTKPAPPLSPAPSSAKPPLPKTVLAKVHPGVSASWQALGDSSHQEPHRAPYPEAAEWIGKFSPQITEYRDQKSGFLHPGIGLTKSMLNNMRDHVRAGHEPWLSSYQKMVAMNGGMNDAWFHTDKGQWTFIPWGNDGDFYSRRYRWDAQTAMLRTIRWYITGDERFRSEALRAIRTTFKLTGFNEHWDEQITWSTTTFKLCVVAEILRCSQGLTPETQWTDHDSQEFERVFKKSVRPWYDRGWHMLNQHQYCVKATLSAAIFFDDYEWYKQAVERYTSNGGGVGGPNGSIKSGLRDINHNGITGKAYPPGHAQLIEMGRDMGHSWGNAGGFGDNAQIIESQVTKVDPASGEVSTRPDAVSVFDWHNRQLLRGINFICKYNLGGPAVYLPNEMYWMVNKEERGRLQGLLGLYYYHYKYVAKLPENHPDFAYLVQAFKNMVPERDDTDSWGLGTLLFAPDEAYEPLLAKDIRNFQHLKFESPKNSYLFANLSFMEKGQSQVIHGHTPVQEFVAGSPEKLLLRFPLEDRDNPLKNPAIRPHLHLDMSKGPAEWESLHSFAQYGTMNLRYRSMGGRATLQIYRHWKPWLLATVKLPDTNGQWQTLDLSLEDKYFGACWIFELWGDAQYVDLCTLDYTGSAQLTPVKVTARPTRIGITGVKPILQMTFEDSLNNHGTAKIAPLIRDFAAKPQMATFVPSVGGGKALHLDGSVYLDYGFSPELQPPSMTFACCIRIPANPFRPSDQAPTMWDGEQVLFWTKKYNQDPGVIISSQGKRPLFFSIGGKRTFKNQDNKDQTDVREVYTEGNRAHVFALDSWAHLAVTYDAASGIAELYINGKKREIKEDLHLVKIDQPTAKEFRPVLETKNLIGTDKNSSKLTGINGAWYSCISKMDLDDLVLYPAAATASEINSLYQASMPKIVAPVFDHITGVTPILACSFDGHLQQSGSLTQRLVVRGKDQKACPPYFVDDGIQGKALHFANDSYLDLGGSPALEPRSVSYSAWIRPNDSIIGEQIFLWTKDRAEHEGWYINSSDKRALMLSIGSHRGADKGGIREVFVDRPRNEYFHPGEWTHVAVTYSHKTGDVALYINGEPMTTRESSRSPLTKDLLQASFVQQKVIGINGPYKSAYSQFDLDNLTIWPGAATPSEVKALYHSIKRAIDK